MFGQCLAIVMTVSRVGRLGEWWKVKLLLNFEIVEAAIQRCF